jgi:hypothetical protein
MSSTCRSSHAAPSAWLTLIAWAWAAFVARTLLDDLRGDLLEQLVAPGPGQSLPLDGGVEQDFEIDLAVRGVYARGVVDEVGVDRAAGEGVLHPSLLGDPEVAAFDDHTHPQLAPVDPDAVVGPVTNVEVGLGGGLDVGADPAVEQQEGAGAQHRPDQLIARQVLGLYLEQGPHLV